MGLGMGDLMYTIEPGRSDLPQWDKWCLWQMNQGKIRAGLVCIQGEWISPYDSVREIEPLISWTSEFRSAESKSVEWIVRHILKIKTEDDRESLPMAIQT